MKFKEKKRDMELELTDGNAGEGGSVHAGQEARRQGDIDAVPLGDEAGAVAPRLRQFGQRLPQARRREAARARLQPHLEQHRQHPVAQLVADVVCKPRHNSLFSPRSHDMIDGIHDCLCLFFKILLTNE